jgi:NDP-sugar pyrophosphorylase family protein
LNAIGDFLKRANTESRRLSGYKQNGSKEVWRGNNLDINNKARLLGPVIVGDQTKISEDVIILGPAVIGSNVTVGRGTLDLHPIFLGQSTIKAFSPLYIYR